MLLALGFFLVVEVRIKKGKVIISDECIYHFSVVLSKPRLETKDMFAEERDMCN